MDRSLDLSRWRDVPRGVGYRRWTILQTGLRQLLKTRFFRLLLLIAWMGGIAIGALGFVFSQSVASGGWLETAAIQLGARPQAIAAATGAFVLLFPEICIGGVFTGIFWLHSFLGLGLSLVALTALVPRLLSRDRATHALTVYLSRPLTSVDYLLGKLGIILGVLALMWTGPLLGGWLLSLLFAPERDFWYYSLAPLRQALIFHAIAVVTLASLALGISALSKTPRFTVMLWLGLWIVAGTVAKPDEAPRWLSRASFTHNLGEVRQHIFRLDTAFKAAAENLPLLDPNWVEKFSKAGRKAEPKDVAGSAWALGAFVLLASGVFFRKLRAE